MNITPRTVARFAPQLTVFVALLVVISCMLAWLAEPTAGSSPRLRQLAITVALPTRAADAEKVTGAQSCQKCHQDEYAQWLKTMHSKTLDEYLLNQNDKAGKRQDYAKALGIPVNEIAKHKLCTACHATRQNNDAGELSAISGVSCESCHGASGGETNGWLKLHGCYDYFSGGDCTTKRVAETEEHRRKRVQVTKERGKISPDNLYRLAKNCFRCHIVNNEKLVSTAGHPAETQKQFEFASWTNGEIRHNFHLNRLKNKQARPGTVKNSEASTLWLNPVGADADQQRSAINRRRMMFVIGLLAELETRLRMRAKTQNLAFIGKFAGKIPAMQPKLLMINAPETQKVAGLIPTMLGRLFAVQPNDEIYFNKQADIVAEAAMQFQKNHDGSMLQSIDAMIPQPHYSKQYQKK